MTDNSKALTVEEKLERLLDKHYELARVHNNLCDGHQALQRRVDELERRLAVLAMAPAPSMVVETSGSAQLRAFSIEK